MRNQLTTLCVLLAITPVISAAQIQVPGQVGDLQQAINLASPGDVIVVSGGTWDDIIVNKALTIVGVVGQVPTMRSTGAASAPYGAVELTGPGSGTVQLVNLNISAGVANGIIYGQPFEGITGGGFDEIRVLHCSVSAGVWQFPTGLGDGGDGIDVDAPLLLVEDCTVQGGSGVDDGSGLYGLFLPKSGRGVVNTGDVIVTDSTVIGADGLVDSIFDPFGCPSSVSSFFQGDGGTAVEAGGTLWRAQSTLSGGAGSVITCQPTGQVYTKPDGAAVDAAADVILPGDLQGSGEIALGQLWQLSFTAGGPLSFLVLGFPGPPVAVGNKGLLFLDPNALQLFSIPGAGVQVLPLRASLDISLVGITVGLQVYDPSTFQLTNPVFGTFVDD